MLLVAEIMPATSDSVPLIGKWIFSALCTMCDASQELFKANLRADSFCYSSFAFRNVRSKCQPGLHHVHIWKGPTWGYKKALELLGKQVTARIEGTQNQHCRKFIFFFCIIPPPCCYTTPSLLPPSPPLLSVWRGIQDTTVKIQIYHWSIFNMSWKLWDRASSWHCGPDRHCYILCFYRTTPLPWSHGVFLQGRENKPVLFFKIKTNEHYLKDLWVKIVTKVQFLDR